MNDDGDAYMRRELNGELRNGVIMGREDREKYGICLGGI